MSQKTTKVIERLRVTLEARGKRDIQVYNFSNWEMSW